MGVATGRNSGGLDAEVLQCCKSVCVKAAADICTLVVPTGNARVGSLANTTNGIALSANCVLLKETSKASSGSTIQGVPVSKATGIHTFNDSAQKVTAHSSHDSLRASIKDANHCGFTTVLDLFIF